VATAYATCNTSFELKARLAVVSQRRSNKRPQNHQWPPEQGGHNKITGIGLKLKYKLMVVFHQKQVAKYNEWLAIHSSGLK
jgi:hypothetical protein